jgi:very-short-patch-repair endonuclease
MGMVYNVISKHQKFRQPNMYKAAPHTIINARKLRKSMTDAERLLWSKIRNEQLGVKFRKQVPIGRYIVDFYSYQCHIAIELDGSQHLDQVEYDTVRTAFLAGDGITVLRFWNNEALSNIDGVVGVILAAVDAAKPSPTQPPP